MRARTLIILAAVASPLLMAQAAPSGCANAIDAKITQAAADINAIDAALQDPATQQAIATLKAGATMLACGFADAASETAAVSAVLSDSKSGGVAAIKHSATVAYVITGSLCPAMGGALQAPVVVTAADLSKTTKTQ